jgi:hypothetical protein
MMGNVAIVKMLPVPMPIFDANVVFSLLPTQLMV